MSSTKKKITEVKDACEFLGTSLEEITPYPNPKNDRQKAVNSFEHAIVVIEALNQGRVPDYDTNERKWELWWNMRSPAAGGPGFSLFYVRCRCSVSGVGARLVFIEKQDAEYFAEHFKHLFEGFMVVKK
ncbi:MAG: hypothetical protein ABIN80_22940 [Dyadobacter sp.]|uniref:hypothetical protein n=1 Tax=Dyadobacter sp. TaxID=1914288 RepID=UPI0032666D83